MSLSVQVREVCLICSLSNKLRLYTPKTNISRNTHNTSMLSIFKMYFIHAYLHQRLIHKQSLMFSNPRVLVVPILDSLPMHQLDRYSLEVSLFLSVAIQKSTDRFVASYLSGDCWKICSICPNGTTQI